MTQTVDADAVAHTSRHGRGPGMHDAGPDLGIGRPEPRYRRRPALIGLGIGLLAVCGAGAAYLTQLSSDTVHVVAVAADVHRGQVIGDSDITTAQAASDPAVDPVPAHRRDRVVGQRAASDLTAGTLLTSAAVTPDDLPADGETVVGVAVTEAQMPREEMTPGDRIRIFDTPNPGDDPPADPPPSTPATVLSVSGLTENGQVIVDVVVDEDVAGGLVARVATGRVAVVLDSAEDGESSRP